MQSFKRDLDRAVSILESVRYQVGIAEFIPVFIDEWAYCQTGLYPPKQTLTGEIQAVARELSHHLGKMMEFHIGKDVLGAFFSECGYYKQGLSFFPTPSELSELLNQITGPKLDSEYFYEPCCGTGSITLKWIQNKFNKYGAAGLLNTSIKIEDISQTMCKAALIQIVHLLANLDVQLRKIQIECIDTLSLESKGVIYILEHNNGSV